MQQHLCKTCSTADKKQLHTNCSDVFKSLSSSPHFVANSAAKQILKSTTKTKIVGSKTTTLKRLKKPKFGDDHQFGEEIIQQQQKETMAGGILTAEKQRLEQLQTTGTAAFGSVKNLHKASKVTLKQV